MVEIFTRYEIPINQELSPLVIIWNMDIVEQDKYVIREAYLTFMALFNQYLILDGKSIPNMHKLCYTDQFNYILLFINEIVTGLN